VQWLVWHKADTSARSKRGWTALHVASIRGQDKCVQALLSGNADMSVKDPRGRTPSYLAAAHGNSYTLQSLLRAGADVNMADQHGWTPAHAAAYHGRTGALKVLIQWGAQLDDVDRSGNTAIHLAASEGQLQCIKFIICSTQGTVSKILNARNDEGDTPLNVSENFHRNDCADYLRAIEWDLEHGGDEGGTVYPAHTAAYKGDLQALQSLITKGIAGINDRDDTNSTPAHKAAGSGHVECLRWLMEMGADMSLLNEAGETPREVAKRYGQLGCISLLGGESDEEASEDSEPAFDEHSQERALQRIKELAKKLEMAKANYRQLGGSLEEDKKEMPDDAECAKTVKELNGQLERERVRREKLEAQIDDLKGKLYSAKLAENSDSSLTVLQSSSRARSVRYKFDTHMTHTTY
jgi:ankyrin repeat domain-containing protein 42